jgi:hypothetical protein
VCGSNNATEAAFVSPRPACRFRQKSIFSGITVMSIAASSDAFPDLRLTGMICYQEGVFGKQLNAST